MDAFWLLGNLSRAPPQEGGGSDEVAGKCCRGVKGDRTLFPFLQHNLPGSMYFTGPCQSGAGNSKLQQEHGSPPVRGSGRRAGLVPALPCTDGVSEGFAPLTATNWPRGGWGLERGQCEDKALLQSPLNEAVSFGGLLHLPGALQARAEGVSPSEQMTFSDGCSASKVALFALFPTRWRKEEMFV